MGKKIGYSILFTILLLILFRIDVPLDTFRRSYEYPGITYISAHYISLLGSGGVLTGIAVLIFIYGLLKDSEKTIQIAQQLLISLIITGIIIAILKLTIGRIRPKFPNKGLFVLFPSAQAGIQSFPSGHSAAVFCFAPILATLSPLAGMIAYALASLVALSRIHSDLHFVSDVVIGILLGFGVGKYAINQANKPIRLFKSAISEKKNIIYSILAILLLSYFLFFYKLGTPGLFDLDESVFAESTREMLESDNWITPYMNYEPRFDKPILIYWLMAIAYKIFGINEFAARFWSALNGTILALFIFYFGKKWKNIKFGLLSSLIFLTCIETNMLGHAAITDMTLMLFLTIAMVSFYLAYSAETVQGKRWYWLFYISMAFAMLTKGLVGFIFPGIIIFLFLLSTRQFKATIREAKVLSGIAIFLLIGLPWYILVYQQNGWEFIQKFILFHHLHRYTGEISGHSGNILYYFGVILIGFFPWSSFLGSSIRSAIPWQWNKWKDLSKHEQLPLLCILWIIIVLVFFTIAKTKLPNYVGPLFPPLAFLVALWWHQRFEVGSSEIAAQKTPRNDKILLLILGLILASAFLILPLVVSKLGISDKFDPAEALLFKTVPYLLSFTLIVGTVGSVRLLWRKKHTAGFIFLVVMMLIFWYAAMTGLVPIVYEYLQGPLYRYATVWRNELQPNDIIIEFGCNNPSVIFYSHHPILRLGTNQFDRLNELFQSSNRVYLITNKLKMLNQFEQLPKFQLIKIDGQYLFGKNF